MTKDILFVFFDIISDISGLVSDFEQSGIETCIFRRIPGAAEESAELLDALRIRIEDAAAEKKVFVLFSASGMNSAAENFLRALPEECCRIPAGSDAVMTGISDADYSTVKAVSEYFSFGGRENIKAAGNYIRKYLFNDESADEPVSAAEIPLHGIYSRTEDKVYRSLEEYMPVLSGRFESYAGILIHRHGWINDNLAAVYELEERLNELGTGTILVFSDAGETGFSEIAERCLKINGRTAVDVLISFSSFLMKAEGSASAAQRAVLEYEKLGVPVFSPVQSLYLTYGQWRDSINPLSSDMSANLISQEMSGITEPLIIGTVNRETQKTEPITERIEYFASRVQKYTVLRKKKNSEKKLVIMLHNAVCSGAEATIGKAFGLDAFESTARLLEKLKHEGYETGEIPKTGEELYGLIKERKAFSDFRWTSAEDIAASGGDIYRMAPEEYSLYFSGLPQKLQDDMNASWGEPPGEGMVLGSEILITGILFGNVLTAVQPKRGCYGAKCTGEVCRILHDPACPPPHQYFAVYSYIRNVFNADAVIDVGSDGNCEYLPGKANGLSELCWPHVIMGTLPSFYIYNAGAVNESLCAKRRMNSVIVDHLPVPYAGHSSEEKLLLRRISDYTAAAEGAQTEQIERELRELAAGNDAAGRILAAADSFENGLSMISDRLTSVLQSGRTNKNHIFGKTPDEAVIEDYINEVKMSEEYGSEDAEADIMLEENLRKCAQEADMLIRALSGGYIPSGPSGMPDENGRNILPTGRNMHGLNTDRIPTRFAYERGIQLAETLLSRYMQDEGRLPEKIAMDMISLDITRTNGEQLSQFLYLLGIKPVWDSRERVCGIVPIDISVLNRPRIDVTVRITGVLRDTWPSAVDMMDEAVLLAASLEETQDQNYIIKHLKEQPEAMQDQGNQEGTDTLRPVRIFGDAPGTYGAGLDLALLASAWNDEEDLVRYFIDASAFAYGKNLDGRRSVKEFVESAKDTDLTSDISGSARVNALICGFGVQVHGGFRLLAKYAGNKDIRQYQSINEKGKEIVTETLEENLIKLTENTLMNDFWKQSCMQRGYDGASDIMQVFQGIFSAQCLNDIYDDDALDRLAEAYINDRQMLEWFFEHNPYAAEEMSRRMLELHSRGKYNPDSKVLEKLKSSHLIIEGEMEGSLECLGEIQGGSTEIISHKDVSAWAEKIDDIEKILSEAKK